jgi:hypothetical protein
MLDHSCYDFDHFCCTRCIRRLSDIGRQVYSTSNENVNCSMVAVQDLGTAVHHFLILIPIGCFGLRDYYLHQRNSLFNLYYDISSFMRRYHHYVWFRHTKMRDATFEIV